MTFAGASQGGKLLKTQPEFKTLKTGNRLNETAKRKKLNKQTKLPRPEWCPWRQEEFHGNVLQGFVELGGEIPSES